MLLREELKFLSRASTHGIRIPRLCICVYGAQAHHRQDNGGTVRIGALSSILRIATQDRSNRIASSCRRAVATLSLSLSSAPTSTAGSWPERWRA